MAITVEKTVYSTWGNCIRVSNGVSELFATLDIGPQIIRYGIIGKSNMFFEDINNKVNKDLSAFKKFEKDTWRIYGGHRFWVSPEAEPQSYYPAADPVDYEILSDGVILNQRTQEYTNIQLTMTVTMAEDGTVTVVHKLTNTGAWPVELSPWGLSVLSQGGVEVVPQVTRSTGLLGNRVFAIWPYTNMSDPRVTWGQKYIILRQDPNDEKPFKFGSNNENGYAAYFNHGCLLVKKYNPATGGKYPDFGVSFETYTNNNFLEMETLGELKTIAPNDYTSHTETWNLYDNININDYNEQEIEKTLKSVGI